MEFFFPFFVTRISPPPHLFLFALKYRECPHYFYLVFPLTAYFAGLFFQVPVERVDVSRCEFLFRIPPFIVLPQLSMVLFTVVSPPFPSYVVALIAPFSFITFFFWERGYVTSHLPFFLCSTLLKTGLFIFELGLSPFCNQEAASSTNFVLGCFFS